MSKEKQIAKMTEDICGIENKGMKCLVCGTGCDCRMLAEALYNVGYRKQSEGEWISIKIPTGVEMFGVRETQDYPKCSVCGYMRDVSECHFKYCPNCGAKMKGVNYDQ